MSNEQTWNRRLSKYRRRLIPMTAGTDKRIVPMTAGTDKRIIPMTAGTDKRIIPLTVGDNNVVPMMPEDMYDYEPE